MNQRGVSLVELMVATLVFSSMILFGMKFLILQQAWAVGQEDAAEAQQELRAALDLMGRELALLGFGLPQDETGLLKADPDGIEFLADLHGLVTVLTEEAKAGRKEVSVASGAGFKQGRRVSICSRDRCEWKTLAADGGFGRLEFEKGLGGDFPTGSAIHLINQIRYSIKPIGDGHFQLLRTVDGGTQPVAERLIQTRFDYLDRAGRAATDPKEVDRVRIFLSAKLKRAAKPTRSMMTEVYLRNGGGEYALP